MSGTETKSIDNLLQQINLIINKYDDLAEYTGENFNIFNVLNIYSDELIHSAFIGNLLNAKGKHGQKDTFLKLFIEEVENTFLQNENQNTYNQINNLKKFNTKNSKAIIEKHIGKINNLKNEGGRIDIVINDNKNNIFIENKIWAVDQFRQIRRYYESDKNAQIIYLTLDGKEPLDESKNGLVNYKDFICISYKNNIISWLDKCIKEMANKPIIRETLNQYLKLVKLLTNQSTNNYMGEDVKNQILKNEENFKAFQSLIESQYLVIRDVIENDFIHDIIDKIALEYNLEVKVDEGLYSGIIYNGISLSNDTLSNKNLYLRIDYQSGLFKNPLFGFAYKDKTIREYDKYLNLKIDFEHFFGSTSSNENFASYMINSKWTKRIENLGNFNNLHELRFGNSKNEMYNDFKLIISKMLEIALKQNKI